MSKHAVMMGDGAGPVEPVPAVIDDRHNGTMSIGDLAAILPPKGVRLLWETEPLSGVGMVAAQGQYNLGPDLMVTSLGTLELDGIRCCVLGTVNRTSYMRTAGAIELRRLIGAVHPRTPMVAKLPGGNLVTVLGLGRIKITSSIEMPTGEHMCFSLGSAWRKG